MESARALRVVVVVVVPHRVIERRPAERKLFAMMRSFDWAIWHWHRDEQRHCLDTESASTGVQLYDGVCAGRQKRMEAS
jgi:hypothetical protein